MATILPSPPVGHSGLVEEPSKDRHVERLTAPAPWWLGIVVFAAVVGWLLLVAAPPAVALAIAGALLVAGAVVLARAGAIGVTATPGALRVGDAHLEAPHLGAVEPLDRDAWRAALARGGTDRAFLLTRPWIDRGVRVEVADASDPTPYWLVSTRYPDAVARAVGHTGPSTDGTAPGAGDRNDEGTDDGQEARGARRSDDLD